MLGSIGRSGRAAAVDIVVAAVAPVAGWFAAEWPSP